MLCRKGSVSAGQGRRFCGKADRYGSRMARLTAMALRTMPKCPRNSRDLGLCRQVAGKRRPKSRKPCHNGQPCHREATTVSLAICGLPYGRHSGKPRQSHAFWMPERSTLPSSPCRPDARAVGFTVRPVIRRPGAFVQALSAVRAPRVIRRPEGKGPRERTL